jgi:hypothetical protein
VQIRIWTLASIVFTALSLSACGGSGGGDGNTPPPSNGEVTVAGKITFDRPPFNSQVGNGINIASPVEVPARQVVVEAIDAGSSTILASTTTDASGDYSLLVPANRSLFVRAKAQMLKSGTAPTWNFRVLNNTNGDALYALDGTAFNSGTATSTRNLRATTGWGTTNYTGTRAAAPFAILDTVYRAKELVLTAEPSAAFPDLDLFWSSSNRTAEPLCPDLGNIVTSLYQGEGRQDECSPATPMPAGIYILGDFASGGGDTDEFDQHVIAHEFGHYYEDRFSRSDSIGGSHGGDDRLDFRVAFGEGWGNAYAAMSLLDPAYRDSFEGIDSDFSFNLESDGSLDGWFSESSVGEILWDIYDVGSESGDTVALGFSPIYATMTGTQISTEALTSIFSFAEGIRAVSLTASTSIETLLVNEDISVTDEFGADEDNDGGDSRVLPLYQDIALNVPLASVCTRATSGSLDNNKLGNRKFLRFANNTARMVTIQATGASSMAGTVPATDPDVFVFLRGDRVAAGTSTDPSTETLRQISLEAGTHIIEVYDFDLSSEPATTRCMTVSISG